MAGWRKGTFSHCSLYMSKWFKFASCNKVSSVEPPAQVALAFLTSLVSQGKSFNQISLARSALLSVINQQQNVNFNNIPIVKRYMEEIFPKFQFTSNVSLLFNHFHSMQEIQALDIQKLTQKLVLLMKLISGGQRVRTIHSIRVSDIKILVNKVVIPIMPLIKQTKPTKYLAPLCFQVYNKEPKLCVVSHNNEYLKKTKTYRHTDKLFLTCIKPYREASKYIISRWCKPIIKESGINIHSYTTHLELQLHPMESPAEHCYPQ